MKPYSKKYLTLALAGVLAASIPVSAFATEVPADPSIETKVTDPADKNKTDKTDDKNKAGDKTETGNKSETDKKTEEDKKADKDKIEELEKKIKDLQEKEKEKEKEENRRKYGNITLSNVRYDGNTSRVKHQLMLRFTFKITTTMNLEIENILEKLTEMETSQ